MGAGDFAVQTAGKGWGASGRSRFIISLGRGGQSAENRGPGGGRKGAKFSLGKKNSQSKGSVSARVVS